MQVLDVWFPVLASKPGSSNVREGRNLACWKRGSRAFPASQACTSLVGSSTWYILTSGEAHLVELTSHQCGCGGRARRLPRARSEEHLQGHCGRSPRTWPVERPRERRNGARRSRLPAHGGGARILRVPPLGSSSSLRSAACLSLAPMPGSSAPPPLARFSALWAAAATVSHSPQAIAPLTSSFAHRGNPPFYAQG